MCSVQAENRPHMVCGLSDWLRSVSPATAAAPATVVVPANFRQTAFRLGHILLELIFKGQRLFGGAAGIAAFAPGVSAAAAGATSATPFVSLLAFPALLRGAAASAAAGKPWGRRGLDVFDGQIDTIVLKIP